MFIFLLPYADGTILLDVLRVIQQKVSWDKPMGKKHRKLTIIPKHIIKFLLSGLEKKHHFFLCQIKMF